MNKLPITCNTLFGMIAVPPHRMRQVDHTCVDRVVEGELPVAHIAEIVGHVTEQVIEVDRVVGGVVEVALPRRREVARYLAPAAVHEAV